MAAENKIRTIRIIGALLGWFALIAQFYLIITNRVESVPETIIRYFSFYTILTNILVALCFTIPLLSPASNAGRFFLRTRTITSIAVYITVVGIVYNVILRSLWEPQGMQKLVDELLHTIIPIVFIIYWILFRPKSKLTWTNAIPWLVYPLVYILFILWRGKLSGFYPYPFIDVTSLGYDKVLLHSFFLCIAFLVISVAFILVSRLIQKQQSIAY